MFLNSTGLRKRTQRSMGVIPALERLNIVEAMGARLVSRGEPPMMDHLVLRITEEAFDDRIVVAIAFAAHADRRNAIKCLAAFVASTRHLALVQVKPTVGVPVGTRHRPAAN